MNDVSQLGAFNKISWAIVSGYINDQYVTIILYGQLKHINPDELERKIISMLLSYSFWR